MNEKTTRNLWMVTTALISATIIIVFGSGGGTSINLRAPIMLVVTALLGLSSGIAAVIYVGVFVKIKHTRSRVVPYQPTSSWHLAFWALCFLTYMIAIPVGRGSISLDLPTGLVFVMAVILSSGGLWIQHGFLVSGRGGYPGKDERTEGIQGKVALYTLAISLSVMVIMLMIIMYLGSPFAFPEISRVSAAPFLISLLAITLGTYFVFHWYFGRRRDS